MKPRIISALIFCLMHFLMNAQVNNTINQIDSAGNKVGLWIIVDSTDELTLVHSSVYHKGNSHMSCEFETWSEQKYFVREFGSYKNGLKEGKWNTFYSNGTQKGCYQFKSGKLQPNFIRFTENNTLKYEIHETDSPNVFKVIDLSKAPSQGRMVQLREMNVFYE